MANPKHLAILKQGVEVWNEWRKCNPDVIPDLEGANIDGIQQVRRSHLKSGSKLIVGLKDLSGINLRGAKLRGSTWAFVNFRGADLSNLQLRVVTLHSCVLTETCLNNSLFLYTFLGNCGLSRTDFSMSSFAYTVFSNCNLDDAIGLEKATHLGPSTIGIDTILDSRGQIPEPFLRGCGVPEDFIKLIPSLTAQPFEFYKCFISHSSLDMDFCNRLHADLQNGGVRVWLFQKDARTGRGVWDEIDQSIKIYDKLMVVCSENSLQSGPVLREIERALQREDREHKHILFPIRIDDYIFDEWEHPRKADVIAKVVGDFSNWKDHDSYQKAFDRLMRDLKDSEE